MKQIHHIAGAAIILAMASCLIGAAHPPAKCARCGCSARCKKVCKLVCEEKDVEVICWGCKHEPFCVPGPGCPSCRHCECVCKNCNEGEKPVDICHQPKRFVWTNFLPSFAQMYQRTKLMKKVETVKVPTYKWVVEEVCCDCACGGDLEVTDAEAMPLPKPVPPPALK
jgi:hypothetical protein